MQLGKIIDFYHTSKLGLEGELAVWEIGHDLIREARSTTFANGQYGFCATKGEFVKETLIGIPVIIEHGDRLCIRFNYPDGRERAFEADLDWVRRP